MIKRITNFLPPATVMMLIGLICKYTDSLWLTLPLRDIVGIEQQAQRTETHEEQKHERSITSTVCCAVGGLLSLSDRATAALQFDPEVFIHVLLPPLVFHSGFTIPKVRDSYCRRKRLCMKPVDVI